MNTPVDFLIIAPLREELDAILRRLPALKLPPSDEDVRTYYSANLATKLSDRRSASYKIVVAPLLGMGRIEAANATGDAIRRWQPRYVLLVGIAGGYGKAGVSLGDVLISEQVVDYELQKLTESTESIRWKVHAVDPRLLGAAQNIGEDAWVELVQVRRPRKGKPQIRFGPICTGDKVIANGLLDQYSDVWTKLIGVEMEAGGVASATYQAPSRPGFFMIRGVSDLADRRKDTTSVKKWRAYASDVAASFAIGMLKEGPIPTARGETRRQLSLKRPSQFWNARLIDSSYLHERSAPDDPTVLIVFLHGLGGHPVKTWGNLPKWLLEAVGTDVDMISYTNSSPLSHSTIGQAASRLARLILNRAQSYMHILFITHGAGSLVVRELLAEDVESGTPKTTNVLSRLPPIMGKTRAVFDFADPADVSHTDLSVEEINKRFHKSLDLLDANDFPRPRVVQFVPEDGGGFNKISEPFSSDSHFEELIQGLTSSQFCKLAVHRDDPRLSDTVARVLPYFNSPDMALSYLTLRRFVGLDGAILPTGEEADAKEVGSKPGRDGWVGWYGSQQFTLRRLNELSDPSQKNQHPLILITGGAGVGKSVVLRRHARHAAKRYLERQAGARLCLYVPMQSITLDESELKAMRVSGNANDGWRALSGNYSLLVHNILVDPQEETAFSTVTASPNVNPWRSMRSLLTAEWIEKRVFEESTEIILDGVDEFLINHSSLTVETISQLVRGSEVDSHKSNTVCILAARNTLPAVAELSRRKDDIYEILPLSEITAEKMFPGTRRLLHSLQDQNLRRLLLSPLILVRLGPHARRVEGLLNTRATILRLALEALIEESQLTIRGKQYGSGLRVDSWMQALAIAAWALYRDNLGFITVPALTRRITELRVLWSKAYPLSHCFADGLEVLENAISFKALRSRTVLGNLGRDSLRFTHREWEDYLVSDYLAQCILGQVFSELDFRAFSKQIYIDAAEVLWQAMSSVGSQISSHWIDCALPVADPFSRPYTLMNICALLGNGPVDIDQVAFGKLMELVCDPKCPEVIRIVAVSSFGMRVLRAEERDQSMKYMVAEIVKALSEIVRQGIYPHRKVTASMAWCYRAELFRRNPQLGTIGNEPWPALNAMTETGVEAAGASGIVWKKKDDSILVDDRCKSFQIAAAQYPLHVRGLLYEEISLTHYLFLATATLRAGAATSEIFPLLRAVFSKESGVEERMQTFSLPEAKELFASCHEAALDFLV